MHRFANTIITGLLVLFVSACNHSNDKQPGNSHITIDVQPFEDIPEADVNYVFNELKKVYPFVHLNASIPFPAAAYTEARKRYRADSLINFLSRQSNEGHITLGLTTKDISTTKDSVTDWGVMGLGFRPGKSCIASSFRLSKNEQLMQLFKVSIHELGHTQGLPHCAVKNCFMRDAEGRNPTNEEKEFCSRCKKHLVERGWSFL